ncbi:HD domain-containing phosphohydrolase [Hydrogenoanaerobacterium sp.]|uniref:HD-GYP domain-containing protein n=1 Tax=Hydrogenoanaerobacterium sp. TaxID=2953763 RepID=UPI002896FFC9|nr:HD domain-containing phosphohydrolase [Hydrogenoanaerobacterium sp.]
MVVLQNQNVIPIICRTLSLVDARLLEHGERVAYMIYKMMQFDGTATNQEMQRVCFLGLMHDIGAYKTEEIDNIVKFETHNIWEHSVYGYLFLKHFSSLSDLADAILYHHLDYDKFSGVDCANKDIAMVISLTDRLDIYLRENKFRLDDKMYDLFSESKFSPDLLDLFICANNQYDIVGHLADGSYLEELTSYMANYPFTPEEVDQYLKLLVYVIDFRSETTVSHTIMTVSISVEIAKLLHLNETQKKAVYYGALLHDLGKISTPLAILENPGKLTYEEMRIMKHHVVVTEELLTDYIDSEVCKIAVRHHEKLDGSGYPHKLIAGQLSPSERAVAIADIMSALCGKRSYKDSFSKEKTIGILTKMAEQNKICSEIVGMVVTHYDEVLGNATQNCSQVLEVYENLKTSFYEICSNISEYEKQEEFATV